jgi:hypothetical protein
MGGDIADGAGQNYSTFHIFDISNPKDIKHCASFQSNTIDTIEFSYVLAMVGTMFNNVPIFVERNNMGQTVIKFLNQVYEYENIASSSKDETSQPVLGIYSSNKKKVQACLHVRDMFKLPGVEIEINDPKLLDELQYFERIGKDDKVSFCGVKGKNDDHAMAFIWAMFAMQENILDYFYDVSWSMVGLHKYPSVVRPMGTQEINSNEQLEIINYKHAQLMLNNTTNNVQSLENEQEMYSVGFIQ